MATFEWRHEIISDKDRARFDRERWEADRVAEIPDGFTIRRRGREGSIYYREGSRVIEIPYEISGDDNFDILLSRSAALTWILPDRAPVDSEKQASFLGELTTFLKEKNVRVHFED